MLTVDKWEQSSVHVSPLTTPWNCQQLHTNQSTVVQHLKQKSPPVNSLRTQAFISLNYLLLTVNLLFVRLLPLQLSHWTRGFRALLKDNLHHKQVVGDGLSTTAFRTLAKPLHLRSVLRKWRRRCKKAQCLWLALAKRKGQSFPRLCFTPHCTINALQLSKLSYITASHTILTWPLPPHEQSLQHLHNFLQEDTSKPEICREHFLAVC